MSYTPDEIISTDFFVLLFFLLYVAVSILFSLRQKPDLKGYVSGSLVFGLPLATFAIHASIIESIEYGLAWSALGFGVFYLILARVIFATRQDNLRLLVEAFAALGVIFGSLAIPMAFDQRTTAAMWAVEGAGLLWIGTRQDRRLARAFGLLLQLLGGIAFLMDLHELTNMPAVFNSAYIGTLMLTVSGLLSALWLFRNTTAQASYEKGAGTAAALWGVAWWLYGGFAEISRSLPDLELGAALAFVAITVMALRLASLRWAWALPTRIAVGLLPLAVLAALAHMLTDHLHPLVEAAWLGWPLLLAAHYRLLHELDREPDDAVTSILPWLHAGAVWLLALLSAWELHWQMQRFEPGVWRELPFGLVPAALLWLLSRPQLRPQWPLAQHEESYRTLAATALAIWGGIWIVLINLLSNGYAGDLPYLPLLNPLDISVALVLVSIAGWWLVLRPEQRERLWSGRASSVAKLAAAVVFFWLNAALIRALHYGLDTPLDVESIAHSTLVQAALSIFWGLLGFTAMIVAARRARRDIWIAGAGLMGVVVIKLFLVDTSGSGTLARIVSFLCVGALLLLTGYLSPLPPRRNGEEPAP